MIVSNNPMPELSEFKSLMKTTDTLLNKDAIIRHDYYKHRDGLSLENDVFKALEEASIGTSFQGTIEKISGGRFPDIVAAKLYGIEVKSTASDTWTSTGSSIMENTRVNTVDRIYMTFGKLGGNPIQFLSRPYEECLSGIVVTHSPRYQIDMELEKKETIFSKMNMPYDVLRKLDDPTSVIIDYYRTQLRPGERLWWSGGYTETVSATVRLWKNLPVSDKRKYTVYGLVNFPEVFGGDYDNYALWLASEGVVDSHIRDQFSAGGKETMILSDGSRVQFPAVYRRLKNNLIDFMDRLSMNNSASLTHKPKLTNSEIKHKLNYWIVKASRNSQVDFNTSADALNVLFERFL